MVETTILAVVGIRGSKWVTGAFDVTNGTSVATTGLLVVGTTDGTVVETTILAVVETRWSLSVTGLFDVTSDNLVVVLSAPVVEIPSTVENREKNVSFLVTTLTNY